MKTNKILTYSSIERRRHGMLGAEAYLGITLFMFPLVPILLAIFSCFVIHLSDELYRWIFTVCTLLLLGVFMILIVQWVLELLTVYLIGEDGELYRLHISLFWYQVKGCMELVDPVGMSGNRFTRLMFMIQNIRIALEKSSDISFDELIQMGKLVRISEISAVCDKKKSISFYGKTETKKGVKNKKIVIRKVYDKIDGLLLYLKTYEEKGAKAAGKQDLKVRRSVEELLHLTKKTTFGKTVRFAFSWTCIVLWLCLFTVYPDLNKLSKMKAGQVVAVTAEVANLEGKKTRAEFEFEEKVYVLDVAAGQVEKVDGESAGTVKIYIDVDNPYEFFYEANYGVSYEPMMVIYLTVLGIYLFSAITQIIIDSFHKKLT